MLSMRELSRVYRTDTVETFASAFREAMAGQELATIVAKVEAAGPKSFHMDLPMLENRFQFWRHCRAFAARAAG